MLWDLFNREFSIDVRLFVLRAPQLANPAVSRGSGLYGPENQLPELSVEEASRLRYLELVRQEKDAKQQRADASADAGTVAKANEAESAKKQEKLMKQLADLLGRDDLDDIPEE